LKQYEVEKGTNLKASSEEWKITETHLIQNSDMVLTLSHDEKEIIKNNLAAKDVRIMPAFFYRDFKPAINDFSKRKDILFVGGFAHKPNVDGVLWFSKEVWPTLIDTLPGVNFIIAGSNPPQEVVDLQSANIIVKGYISESELESIYSDIKMVVIPLRYGAGVKGKTVEAMYHGLPIVTTSDGIEGLLNIENILQPVDSAESFAQKITELYYSDEELKSLSHKEIDYARIYFSEDLVKDLIAEVFNG